MEDGQGVDAGGSEIDPRRAEEGRQAGDPARLPPGDGHSLGAGREREGDPLALLPQIPPGPIAVSESGLRTGADVAQVAAAGAHAVLVGETLLRADDVAAKVRELSLR